jgi:hypothetical protein
MLGHAMTPNDPKGFRAKFVQERFRDATDQQMMAITPFGAVGEPGVILLSDDDTGQQFWITIEQRDQELMRRAQASGRQA